MRTRVLGVECDRGLEGSGRSVQVACQVARHECATQEQIRYLLTLMVPPARCIGCALQPLDGPGRIVQDQAFQAKCFERIRSLRRQGKTLICVSHSVTMVLEVQR